MTFSFPRTQLETPDVLDALRELEHEDCVDIHMTPEEFREFVKEHYASE